MIILVMTAIETRMMVMMVMMMMIAVLIPIVGGAVMLGVMMTWIADR